MKAAVMRDQRIVFDQVPEPTPRDGEVLVRTLACGICGSDLHFLRARRRDAGRRRTPARRLRHPLARHRDGSRVLRRGRSTSGRARWRLAVGTRVARCRSWFSGGRDRPSATGTIPGGYGELMVLTEPLLLPVPKRLPTEHAALTEPMAVGCTPWRRRSPTPSDAALVVGCGPVGLAVIAALRLQGVEADRRRGLLAEAARAWRRTWAPTSWWTRPRRRPRAGTRSPPRGSDRRRCAASTTQPPGADLRVRRRAGRDRSS